MDKEKLLRFASFTEVTNHWYYDVHGEKKCKWSFPPDKYGIEYIEKPIDFYKDVNACIKYLLPLIRTFKGIHIMPVGEGCLLWTIFVSRYSTGFDDSFVGDTLAEAIEKYVDWQSEEE